MLSTVIEDPDHWAITHPDMVNWAKDVVAEAAHIAPEHSFGKMMEDIGIDQLVNTMPGDHDERLYWVRGMIDIELISKKWYAPAPIHLHRQLDRFAGFRFVAEAAAGAILVGLSARDNRLPVIYAGSETITLHTVKFVPNPRWPELEKMLRWRGNRLLLEGGKFNIEFSSSFSPDSTTSTAGLRQMLGQLLGLDGPMPVGYKSAEHPSS